MKPLLNHKEVAAILGKSPFSIRGMVSRGQIPYIKIGRNCRFDPDRIQKWIEEQAKEPRHNGC